MATFGLYRVGFNELKYLLTPKEVANAGYSLMICLTGRTSFNIDCLRNPWVKAIRSFTNAKFLLVERAISFFIVFICSFKVSSVSPSGMLWHSSTFLLFLLGRLGSSSFSFVGLIGGFWLPILLVFLKFLNRYLKAVSQEPFKQKYLKCSQKKIYKEDPNHNSMLQEETYKWT